MYVVCARAGAAHSDTAASACVRLIMWVLPVVRCVGLPDFPAIHETARLPSLCAMPGRVQRGSSVLLAGVRLKGRVGLWGGRAAEFEAPAGETPVRDCRERQEGRLSVRAVGAAFT